MSLRVRVALLTTVVTVVLVAVAGLLMLRSFETGEQRRIDAQLSDQWRDLAQASAAVVRSTRPAFEELLDLGLQAPLSVRVIEAGDVVLSIGSGPAGGFAAAAPIGLSTVAVDGQRWRVLAGNVTPVARPGRSFEVQFASPLEALDAAVAELRRRVGVAAAVMAVAAAGLGWVVGSVALRPIARLRRRAAEVAATTDLTLRVDADEGAAEVDALAVELNRMLERLEEAAAGRRDALMAARSFAAAAAHELRTPLTSMQANVELLASHRDLDHGDRDAALTDLVSQQQRMHGLLEALRMLARGEVATTDLFAEVDVVDLVGRAVREARRRYPDSEFALHVDDDVPLLAGWEEGLRVMIDNLLANAALHGRPPSSTGVAQVTVRRAGAAVELVVSDNGPGIPADERTSVLGRFVRGRAASGTGSGLGLSLVAQQAELHDGEVALGESDLGGAEVTVRLSAH